MNRNQTSQNISGRRRIWMIFIASCTLMPAVILGATEAGASPSSGLQTGTSFTSTSGGGLQPNLGAKPNAGLFYSSDTLVNGTTTQTSIQYISSSSIYISADVVSGQSWTGHLELTGPGIDTNSPGGAVYGTHDYYVSGSFAAGTYCNTAWTPNGAGGYRSMGEICT